MRRGFIFVIFWAIVAAALVYFNVITFVTVPSLNTILFGQTWFTDFIATLNLTLSQSVLAYILAGAELLVALILASLRLPLIKFIFALGAIYLIYDAAVVLMPLIIQ
ncbi:MAG: hypothetical protein AB7S44_03205 [Spirochaetales bacterium]